MKTLHDNTVIIRPDGNGAFTANVPAIPSCHAFSQTPREAQKELEFVFEMICEEYEEEGRLLSGSFHKSEPG